MVTHTCDYANALVLLLFCSPSLALPLCVSVLFPRCVDHTRACVSFGSQTADSDERRRCPAIDLAQREEGEKEKRGMNIASLAKFILSRSLRGRF